MFFKVFDRDVEQRLGFSNIRLGNGAEAERIFRELIDAYSRTIGPESAIAAFSKADAEPFQKHKVETLRQEINKHIPDSH